MIFCCFSLYYLCDSCLALIWHISICHVRVCVCECACVSHVWVMRYDTNGGTFVFVSFWKCQTDFHKFSHEELGFYGEFGWISTFFLSHETLIDSKKTFKNRHIKFLELPWNYPIYSTNSQEQTYVNSASLTLVHINIKWLRFTPKTFTKNKISNKSYIRNKHSNIQTPKKQEIVINN